MKHWRTAPISRTCEWMVGPSRGPRRHCGKESFYAYRSYGGGFYAMCVEHAKPHLAISHPINVLLESGETMARERMGKV